MYPVFSATWAHWEDKFISAKVRILGAADEAIVFDQLEVEMAGHSNYQSWLLDQFSKPHEYRF